MIKQIYFYLSLLENKIIFQLLFISILLIIFIRINIIDFRLNIKVCLCSPAKKENRYLKEFVEHYKFYKVDKIFLYDNNDIGGEHFEEVINEYIQSGYVKIINFRGKKRVLYDMMNDCYLKNYIKYNWLIFYEIDEYIHLKNYDNIKKFLNEDKFNNCESIQLNWVMHTDNDKIYYENKPLKIRFPITKKTLKVAAIKSIFK